MPSSLGGAALPGGMHPDERLCQRYFVSLFDFAALKSLRSNSDNSSHPTVVPLLQHAAKKAPIVVMECISSGNMHLLGGCRFHRVLLDEAAQATEPTSLVPLTTGAAAFVCVGDDKQLPATIFSRRAVALAVSLFERLRKEAVVSEGDGFAQLDVQRRMHSSIASFPADLFYGPGRIANGCSDADRLAIPGFRCPMNGHCRVVFVTHSNPECTLGTSTKNVVEAQILVNVLVRLFQRSRDAHQPLDPAKVACITGYQAQKVEVNKCLRAHGDLFPFRQVAREHCGWIPGHGA